MRQFYILKKNFKVIFRNKSSAFVLLAGPILLIVLVAIFFSGKSNYDLSVGYYSKDLTPLSKEFITSLENSDFVVTKFTSEDACVEKLKVGVVHTCIIFPDNFEISNAKSADLRFIVDYSRINLVYKIIDSVSSLIDVEKNEVSYTLTTVLLKNINETISDLQTFESNQQSMIDEMNKIKSALDAASIGSGKLSFEYDSFSIETLRKTASNLNVSMSSYISSGDELDLIAGEIYEDLSGYINTSNFAEQGVRLTELNSSMGLSKNKSVIYLDGIFEEIEYLDLSIKKLKVSMDENKLVNDQVISELKKSQDLSSSVSNNLVNLQKSTQNTRKKLESMGITNAQTVVSPINTQIEPLVVESSNAQSTFPFLFVLIIMLASLTLSSTLVIFEKKSRAVFRNFMVPVKQSEFTLATFVTVLILMILESLVILIAASYLTGSDVLSNFATVLAIVFVSSTFFVILGMIIGRSFSSQEGAVMASVVVGCLLLFLSNLVVPLESLSPAFSAIIKYNPFIIFSEILRQAFLFELTVGDALAKLFVLFWIAICALYTMMLIDSPRKKGVNKNKNNSQLKPVVQEKNDEKLPELLKK